MLWMHLLCFKHKSGYTLKVISYTWNQLSHVMSVHLNSTFLQCRQQEAYSFQPEAAAVASMYHSDITWIVLGGWVFCRDPVEPYSTAVLRVCWWPRVGASLWQCDQRNHRLVVDGAWWGECPTGFACFLKVCRHNLKSSMRIAEELQKNFWKEVM